MHGDALLGRLGAPTLGEGAVPAHAALLLLRRTSTVSRFAFTPVIVAFGLTADRVHWSFWAIVAARVLWVAARMRRSATLRASRYPLWFGPLVDLALLGGAVAATGAANSPVAGLLLFTPITIGIMFPPRYTAGIGLLAFATYLAVAAPGLHRGDAGVIGGQAIGMLYATAAGVGLAYARTVLTRRAEGADTARRLLIGAGLSLADSERRRISGAIYDTALQLLLAGAQDLQEATTVEVRVSLRRARTAVRESTATLRATVADLHPRAAGVPGVAAAPERRRGVAARLLGGETHVRGRILAALRVLVALLLVPYALVSSHANAAFLPLAAAGVVIALVTLVTERRRPASSRWRFWRFMIDMAFVGGAIAASGAAASPLADVALTFPLLTAFLFPPRASVRLVGVLALAYVTATLGANGPAALGDVLAWLLGAAWVTATGHVFQLSLGRLEAYGHRLEAARRRVLSEALRLAEAERRRIAERLHDEVLQTLMLCGQELDEALEGDSEALEHARHELARGLGQLRDTVAELHPPALEHGGLSPAVRAVVERCRHAGGFESRVLVDPEAGGLRDELVLALVRELVANVAEHARARTLEVRVELRDGIVVSIADDGVGMPAERTVDALAEGHIGLAVARERVEAEGGHLEVATAPGAGVRVSIVLPLAAPAPERVLP